MFAVVLVKVTRPPSVVARGLTAERATEEAETFARITTALSRRKFAPSGISYQVISDDDVEAVRKIEAGDLKFHGIEVLHQVNPV